jgi:hypothetical protein
MAGSRRKSNAGARGRIDPPEVQANLKAGVSPDCGIPDTNV